MAMAERAELVARLSLDNSRFNSAADKSLGKLHQLGVKGIAAGTAIGVGMERLAEFGIRKLGGLITGGINDLALLENATTSVAGAIKQMGLTGQVTAQQVADWGQQIETAVGSAFDDKAITQAATTLIRFGKITPDNLRPAMQVMTDLATKTGDVDSAAQLLAKALADPAKAAGKLARSGVVLTKAQQDQIKAMVAAGDAAGAQKYLLDQLSATTKGAAEASLGPYAHSQKILADVTEEAQKALATGFLPVIMRVRDILSKELAKKSTLDNIKKFGEFLAGSLDKLVTVVQHLPWQAIGDSLKTAGAGAKAVFEALTSLPPWIQAAVATGWGLNKLTGGAISDLFGQGIKLTFGQFFARGSSPAMPMWVQSVTGLGGGVGGAAGGAAAAAGGVGTLAAAGWIGAAVGASVVATNDLLNKTTLDQRLAEGGLRAQQYRGSTAAFTSSKPMPVVDNSPDARGQRTTLDRIRAQNETNRIALVSAQRTGTQEIVRAIRDSKAVVNVNVGVTTRVSTTYATGGTLTSTKSRILESMEYR